MGVGVEGLGDAGVAEPGLHDGDGFAVTDEEAGVVVAQRMETGTRRQSRALDRGSPHLTEPVAFDRGADLGGEQEAVPIACAQSDLGQASHDPNNRGGHADGSDGKCRSGQHDHRVAAAESQTDCGAVGFDELGDRGRE